VQINSIGDKDSENEFQKKLALFIRKNINSFSAGLRQAVKKDLFTVLRECKEEWQSFEAECPKSIDFLSESSRLHFKEVLEFLEVMNIPYSINHSLVGDPDIGSETIFAIKEDNGGLPAGRQELAYGFRFNRLAKKIGCKKDLPGTILNISSRLKKNLKKVKIKITKPDFYLVQFGPEAKLKSFLVLEELYKAGGINVVHSITKDKLGGQIGAAEMSEAPYIILIGQKEALENSVVIRNTATRAQQIVPISELAAKVKELI
jgi:histidyl-tRNA synthetase